MTLRWNVQSFAGRRLRIEYDIYSGVWSAVLEEEGPGGPAFDLREALAEAAGGYADEPWIVALEDQLRADLAARGL